MNHIGIYLSNSVHKNLIIDEIISNNFLHKYIDLSGLHGELYSTVTMNQLINEEIRHDHFAVFTKENPSLLSMSSGQQRKELLSYMMAKEPQYIILDDIYSSLDNQTKQFIINNLNQLATSTLLIQLFYRKEDVLTCIQTVLSVDDNQQIIHQYSLDQFMNLHNSTFQLHAVELPSLFSEISPAINPVIQLNSVSANYGEKQVLKNISWTIRSGEFWQLTGPNGSGKSTLLTMIIGDNPRGYGQDMILFGRKKGTGETVWEIKKQIGYFTPNMTIQFSREDTVENMIISGLVDSIGLYTKPTDLQRNIGNAWLKVLGQTFYHKKFSELSFGQQRILLVVRAMVKQPPLLILDEPTVGLDDENTSLFISLISAIASQRKIAIIYVSHRNETELKPDKIFELKPYTDGSKGYIKIKDNQAI
jgi:molybdate transport system ATP-binding protein